MIFIVYAESKASSMPTTIGLADYSYYFVMQQFKPMLERIGPVIVVDEVAPDVDYIYLMAKRIGEPCVFLSFTPPHKTANDLLCPTIPVFAWEYSTIPNEGWADNERNNWVNELIKFGQSITHSGHTCSVVRAAAGGDYPVMSIPAPLWDKFQRIYNKQDQPLLVDPEEIIVNGWVVDSANFEETISRDGSPAAVIPVSLSGVVYTSVFNPNDGRKNWQDLLSAFCYAFKEEVSATLVLKLTHADPAFCYRIVASELPKLQPFVCRVVLIQGYLSDSDYSALISKTSYVVNSAYGEGQCLPLMEFMSAGKPAVAPNHTGMIDYVNEGNSFVVESSDEWYHWPHDPRLLLKTFRRRISWESLCGGFQSSFREAKYSPDLYRTRALKATQDLRKHCSRDTAEERIRVVLAISRKRNPESYRGRRYLLMTPVYRFMWLVCRLLGVQAVVGALLPGCFRVLERCVSSVRDVARKI
jgi:glycosyltransferase involved in cell wall biosynthesis